MSESASTQERSIRTGLILEVITLAWNVTGVAVLAFAALTARSVALAGFGLDSLIEIAASVVVVWELRGAEGQRRTRALRWIGASFLLLASYVTIQSVLVLAVGFHPRHSVLGIVWTALTAAVMLTLARAKSRTGRELKNDVLLTEGRVTFVDGVLATAVLVGLTLNALVGWWWADPLVGLVIVVYGVKEGVEALRQASAP